MAIDKIDDSHDNLLKEKAKQEKTFTSIPFNHFNFNSNAAPIFATVHIKSPELDTEKIQKSEESIKSNGN